MNRTPLIAGNWKMNTTPKEGIELAKSIVQGLPKASCDVVVCPPFTHLLSVHEALESSEVKLGAQNMHWATSGAHTGEVSADMLRACGTTYVIIGHSERRMDQGETSDDLRKKVLRALEAGLHPIFCVGEHIADRTSGNHLNVIKSQINEVLKEGDALKGLVIAYEPVWAIGTGETATPEQANEVHRYIRSLLQASFGEAFATQTRILYGGSMKPSNAVELLEQSDVDGGLIGGASLHASDFLAIIQAASN